MVRGVARRGKLVIGAGRGVEDGVGPEVSPELRNRTLLRYLQHLLPGKWQKVIKDGNIGEVHYFEHASGQVAGVKFLPD